MLFKEDFLQKAHQRILSLEPTSINSTLAIRTYVCVTSAQEKTLVWKIKPNTCYYYFIFTITRNAFLMWKKKTVSIQSRRASYIQCQRHAKRTINLGRFIFYKQFAGELGKMRGKMCGRSESKGGKPMFRRRSLSHGCSSCESCSSGPFKRAAAFRFSYIEVYYSIFKSIFMPKKKYIFLQQSRYQTCFYCMDCSSSSLRRQLCKLKTQN